jgi:predicted NBD/HSP70 family sugar kinase
VSRQLSRRNIFEALLTQGPISRAELSKVTGLSKQTTSEVVERFEEQGLVRPVGRTSGSIGRTAVLYELSPDAGYCLGVDLGGSKISAAIADFSGNILEESTEPTDKRGGANVVDQIVKLATKLIREIGAHPARIRSAVVGTPGVMNASTGVINQAPNIPHLSELNVVASLSEKFGLNVLIENDVNLGLLGEMWHGCAQRMSDVVFIALGTGIGLGLCANGALVRGFNGAAGEIGYFPIAGDPLRPVVRDQGCLEYEVGAAGILRRYQAAGGKGVSEVRTIFERMSDGDPLALKVIEETARLLAQTVSIVSVFSDPKLIVLGGSIGSRPELVDRITDNAARLIPRPVEIRASALGNRASMIGALSVAVTHLHEELFGVADLSGPLPLPTPKQASLGEDS